MSLLVTLVLCTISPAIGVANALGVIDVIAWTRAATPGPTLALIPLALTLGLVLGIRTGRVRPPR